MHTGLRIAGLLFSLALPLKTWSFPASTPSPSNIPTLQTPGQTPNITNLALPIPESFSVRVAPGPGDPLDATAFWGAFTSAMSSYMSKPYILPVLPVVEPYYDDARTVWLSITAESLEPERRPRVCEIMWALYRCSLDMTWEAEGGVRQSGCGVFRGVEQIAYIRVRTVYHGTPGGDNEVPTTAGEEGEGGLGLGPGNGTVITARADATGLNASTPNPTNLDVETSITSTGTIMPQAAFVRSIFESLIQLASIRYPRADNPLIQFRYSSEKEHVIMTAGFQDPLVDLPAHYSVLTQGLIDLLQKMAVRGRYSEVKFEIRISRYLIYKGEVVRPAAVETA